MKLVRDKIPEIIEQQGGKAITKILDEKQFVEKLIEKIHEETKELSLALTNKTNSVEELADMLELLHAVADYIGTPFGDVEQERQKKLTMRGGFKKRILLLKKST